MEIRPATLADAAKIADLLTQLGYPETEKFIREKILELTGHPDGDLAVAVAEGEVLGFISLHFIPQAWPCRFLRPHQLSVRGRDR